MTGIILDTCTFLWLTTNSKELSKYARDVFADSNNQIFLSVVSSWEISVKYSLGRLKLPEPAERYIPSRRETYDIHSLPLSEEAVLHESKLPKVHSDPFDRMLVCQSIIENMPLLTPDELIIKYPAKTIW